MNTISYEFNKDAGLVYPRGNYEVIFDGKKTGYYFDIAGFVLSTEKNEIYPMLIGPCDTMGCCGFYAEVLNGKHTVVWEKLWHGQCSGEPEPQDELKKFEFRKDFVIEPPFVFDREKYKKLGNELVKEIKKSSPNLYKDFLVDIEKYKSGDRFRI